MGEAAVKDLEQEESPPAVDPQFDDTQVELDRAIEELKGLEDGNSSSTTHQPSHTSASGIGTKASDLIWDIPVEIEIVLGTARLTVARLMELERDNIVELDRRVGEPLNIAVNGRNIAKGEIVMMENDPSKFAIQITELIGR